MPITLNDEQRSARFHLVLEHLGEIVEGLQLASPDPPPLTKEEISERVRNGVPDDPTMPLREAIDHAALRLDAVRTILSDTME